MNMKDYILQKYDVRDRIARRRKSPLQEFANSDVFPFDFIANEGGEFVKMLYYDEGNRTISVLDLLSWSRDDLLKTGDKPLIELYDNYTADFDFDPNFLDPVLLKDLIDGGA